jgi:4-hydroxy-tetrahydrodipicolinate synthase
MKVSEYQPEGVIAATLLALNEDFSIDERSTRRHLSDVAQTRGIAGIAVNGHASEVHACTPREQLRLLEIALDEVGDNLPVISGVYADGSIEAARIAVSAQSSGASALLVFPPHTIGMMGGQRRPEMALTHFRTIAAASDLPLIAFQYPGEYAYPMQTLLRLVEEVPTIRAIKDWSTGAVHERHIRTLQSLPRQVTVLSTNSAWLMASLTMGCRGVLSGSGSVIPDLHVALFEAVRRGDLRAARAINDRIYPLARCFYSDPAVDMHNRMKEALVLLGKMPRAVVRPPLASLGASEIAEVKSALEAAGLC